METDLMTALFKKFHDVCRRERAATEKNVSPRALFVQPTQHFLQFLEIPQRADFRAVEVRAQPAENVPMHGAFPVRSVNIKTNNEGHKSCQKTQPNKKPCRIFCKGSRTYNRGFPIRLSASL
jgi:hypothetical protein